MEEQRDQTLTEEIKWLARGPLKSVQRYSGYIVKGYRFHTKNREKERKSQNSGIVMCCLMLMQSPFLESKIYVFHNN